MNLIEMVKAAGVVGAGGAGFPTHVKLNTNVEYFIVNAAESEPLIETDKYLCRTFADRIIRTIPQIAEAIGASKKVIALKGAYEKEIAALKVAIREQNSDVEIFELGYFYPAGDEQTLIQQVTGRCVPERGLPSDVGCVVDNVGTVLNIADALEGKAVTEKYLSVVGEVEHPIQLRVPIGTSVLECVKAAHPTVSDFALIMGGPMMGFAVPTINYPVLKNNNAILAFSAAKAAEAEKPETPCIRCARCVNACPFSLMPAAIEKAYKAGNVDALKALKVNLCMECGCCAYVCPAKRNLVSVNRLAKKMIVERSK